MANVGIDLRSLSSLGFSPIHASVFVPRIELQNVSQKSIA